MNKIGILMILIFSILASDSIAMHIARIYRSRNTLQHAMQHTRAIVPYKKSKEFLFEEMKQRLQEIEQEKRNLDKQWNSISNQRSWRYNNTNIGRTRRLLYRLWLWLKRENTITIPDADRFKQEDVILKEIMGKKWTLNNESHKIKSFLFRNGIYEIEPSSE